MANDNNKSGAPDPSGGLFTTLGGMIKQDPKDLLFNVGLGLMKASAPRRWVPGNVGAALQDSLANYVNQNESAARSGLLNAQVARNKAELPYIKQYLRGLGNPDSKQPVTGPAANPGNTPFAPTNPIAAGGAEPWNTPNAGQTNAGFQRSFGGNPVQTAAPASAPAENAPNGGVTPLIREGLLGSALGMRGAHGLLSTGLQEQRLGLERRKMDLQYSPEVQGAISRAKAEGNDKLALDLAELAQAQTPEETQYWKTRAHTDAGARIHTYGGVIDTMSNRQWQTPSHAGRVIYGPGGQPFIVNNEGQSVPVRTPNGQPAYGTRRPLTNAQKIQKAAEAYHEIYPLGKPDNGPTFEQFSYSMYPELNPQNEARRNPVGPATINPARSGSRKSPYRSKQAAVLQSATPQQRQTLTEAATAVRQGARIDRVKARLKKMGINPHLLNLMLHDMAKGG